MAKSGIRGSSQGKWASGHAKRAVKSIFNPDQTEYFFQPVADGLDYTSKQYYRKSQTFTNEGHVSLETLSRLADQGIRLI
ncbi:MAG: hypothetical protein IK081_10310 [Lachnospiraceae bacterium]|nr:hypothetical protein [Lachnospiraceae bacterium]